MDRDALEAALVELLVGRRVQLEPTYAHTPYLQALLGDPVNAYTVLSAKPGTTGSDYLSWPNDGIVAQFVVVQRSTRRPVGWVNATRGDLWSGICYVNMAFETGPGLQVWPLEGVELLLRYLAAEFRIRKVFFDLAEYRTEPMLSAALRSGGTLELRKPAAIWAFGRAWDRLTVGLDLARLGLDVAGADEPEHEGTYQQGSNGTDPATTTRADMLLGRRSILRPISTDDLRSLWELFASARGLWYRGRGIPLRPSTFDDFLWHGIFVQFGVASKGTPDDLRGIHIAYGHDATARTAHVASFFDVERAPSFFLLDSSATFLNFLFETFPLDRLFFEVMEPNETMFGYGLAALEPVGTLDRPVRTGTTSRNMSVYSLSRQQWLASARPEARGLTAASLANRRRPP